MAGPPGAFPRAIGFGEAAWRGRKTTPRRGWAGGGSGMRAAKRADGWHAACVVGVGGDGPAAQPNRPTRENATVATNPNDVDQTPLARQGGGPVRTYLFIGAILLVVAAVLLIVFGWTGGGF